MRVLILNRFKEGNLSRFSQELHQDLCKYLASSEIRDQRRSNFTVDLLNAFSWMPKETGKMYDKEVSQKLRAEAKEYDLIHAIGYRAAWACAEAFGTKKRWIFTALDHPKTQHRELLKRLEKAQVGLCASRAIYEELYHVFHGNLKVLMPGISCSREDQESSDVSTFSVPRFQEKELQSFPCPSREANISQSALVAMKVSDLENQSALSSSDKKVMNLLDHKKIVLVWGDFTTRCGYKGLMLGFEKVWRRLPDVYLLFLGTGPLFTFFQEFAQQLEWGDHILFQEDVKNCQELFNRTSVMVCPEWNKGFSFQALEAMAHGVPVLARREGFYLEVIDEGKTGFFFDKDEEGGDLIAEELASLLQVSGRLEKSRQICLDRARVEFSRELFLENQLKCYQGY